MNTWGPDGMDSERVSLFGDFKPRSDTFHIAGSNLSLYRKWIRASDIGAAELDRFGISIHGTARLEQDSVCVIGSGREVDEFALTITDDLAIRESWELIRRCESLVTQTGLPTGELRFREYIFEVLDKAPPTATLFVDKGHWAIECEIATIVLASLEVDLLAKRDLVVLIGIEWVAGLLRYNYEGSGSRTWGLFTLPECQQPEPLRGHITSVMWRVEKSS